MKLSIVRKASMGIIAGVCMVLSMVNMPVQAKCLGVSQTNGFDKAWERSATLDSGKAYLLYGYNTFLINEDYAKANHATNVHYAYIKNGSGIHVGSSAVAAVFSKVEVRHSGATVEYCCFY